MVDAPQDGLYPPFVDAEIHGDRLEVLGDPFGPAGVAAVELPDGSIWEVDHTDPGRLVALDVDAGDPASSPLLLVAFGGDGAMRVTDQARHPDRHDAPSRSQPHEHQTRGLLPEPASDAAGRLVVLTDLAHDPSLRPLARIFAVLELAVRAPHTPGGELFEPLVPTLVDLAESLAVELGPVDLPQIGPSGERRILMSRAFAERFGDRAPAVLELVAERRGARRSIWFGPDPDDEQADRLAAAGAVGERPGPEDIGIERVTASLVEVTAGVSDAERWVRVLRRDGLVLLAQAPLERTGPLDRAQLLIPPDTPDHELEVRIVEVDQLANFHRRPADLIRDAVRAGRAAASAERRGDVGLAVQRWRDCARRWSDAGDPQRSELAMRRTARPTGRFRGLSPLVDDLDPYGNLDPYGDAGS